MVTQEVFFVTATPISEPRSRSGVQPDHDAGFDVVARLIAAWALKFKWNSTDRKVRLIPTELVSLQP